ncbi:carbohydrate ABC transporter permease [Devosia algicola]|uniref:Carbohydrate ABC transporter permease n=1 Tax=Devosia algicola TaxID=3026418 RepID=A0ABY7YMA4_9HYPH|nr:carbohydrate ABC transporter permease [Devosia algicola]WDR02403.1 carbohydrate ABC transporter permease [Devosia algicola]
MAIIALLVSFPLVWMVLSSFKTSVELSRAIPTFWPEDATLSGYIYIFNEMPFGRYFLNSTIVAVASTILAVFTSALAGYIFAKFEFRWKNIIFIAILTSMMMPGTVMLIPRYILVSWLGWTDTYWALIIPQGITVFGIFMMRQYMHGIPLDYIDAARVDGMGEFGIFTQIILPLCKPPIAALAILSFIESWNSLLWPLVVTSSPDMRTLPMGIAGLATVHSPLLQYMLPAATISVIPIIIVFALFQRQFVNAMTSAGLK